MRETYCLQSLLPVRYTKRKHENVMEILSCMNYMTYQWHICSNLKVVTTLVGLQKSYAKFCFLLCVWDSHARSVLYSRKNCPLYKSHTLITKNIAHQPLVDPRKVLLPPLYIKLGLMKNSVKTLDRSGTAFSFMFEKFPRHSMEKIKAIVFIGPRYISFSETFNLISLPVMMRRQPGMPFDMLQLVF